MSSMFSLAVANVIIPALKSQLQSHTTSKLYTRNDPPLKEKKRVHELQCQHIQYYVFVYLRTSQFKYPQLPDCSESLSIFHILFLPTPPPYKSIKENIYQNECATPLGHVASLGNHCVQLNIPYQTFTPPWLHSQMRLKPHKDITLQMRATRPIRAPTIAAKTGLFEPAMLGLGVALALGDDPPSVG